MKLAEVATIVAASFQQFWRGGFIRGDLGIGKVIAKQCTEHVGTKRIASFKEHSPTGGALRHGPDIAKANSGVRNGVDIGGVRGIYTAITKRRQLIDPDVIHDNEENVRPLRRMRRPTESPAITAVILCPHD